VHPKPNRGAPACQPANPPTPILPGSTPQIQTRGLPAALLLFSLPLFGLLGACGEPAMESTSRKARVQAKSGAVWGRDLAQALGLQTWELCSELGSYDCIDDTHRITLGGVEPTVLGVDEPLPNAAISAPIAVDRVAGAACAERWRRDKVGPAVVFAPLFGKEPPSEEARAQVSTDLIRRMYARNPTEAEIESLEALHERLLAQTPEDKLDDLSNKRADKLVADWAIGSCFIVATSTEALFY
jgi:hypothetical protein